MKVERSDEARLALVVTEEELLTLRHCLIEALEALGDDEFRIRTGGTVQGAEALLADLNESRRLFRERG